MEEYLLSQPNYQIRVADLDRTLRQALPAVKKGFQKARTSLRGVLRMFPKQFKVERGLASFVNVPAAPPEPQPAPRPETREERNARLDALLGVSRAREEASRQARLARERERLAGLRGAFPERPR